MKFIKYLANNMSDDYLNVLSISSAIMISLLCGMALVKIGIVIISHPLMGVFYTLFVISSVIALAVFLSGFIASIIEVMRN